MDDAVITFPSTAFEQDYPPDAPGQEAAEHARVWKVYRAERAAHHEKTLDRWNKTFDILLTFAGLYSAALTAFLVESRKKLEEDPTEYLADIVFQVLSSSSTSSSTVIRPDNSPIRRRGDGFTIATSDRIVNVLWFSSLAVTLSVALLCILAKQWIGAYELLIHHKGAPTALYWSRRHVFYHKDLRKWRVPALVTVLPMMLHVALFLFLVGLCLSLVPQDFEIALVVTVIVAVILGFYVIQALLPVWIPTCAWRTPLSRWIHRTLASLRERAGNWKLDDESASPSVSQPQSSPPPPSQVLRIPVLIKAIARTLSLRSRRTPNTAPAILPEALTATPPAPTLTQPPLPLRLYVNHISRTIMRAVRFLVLACCPSPAYERTGIENNSAYFDAQVVKWLLKSSTRSISAVAIQAIGAMSTETPVCHELRKLNPAFLQEYLQARSHELADSALLRSHRAMDERVHCLRAWVVAGFVGQEHAPPLPFSDAIAEYRPGDAAIMNQLASRPYNALSVEPAGGLLSIFQQLAADNFRIRPSLPAVLLTLGIVSANSSKRPPISPGRSTDDIALKDCMLHPDYELMQWAIETEVAVLLHSINAIGHANLKDAPLRMTVRYLELWISSRETDLYHLYHRRFQRFLSADRGTTLALRSFFFGLSIELASMPNILSLDPLAKGALHRGLIWFAQTIIVLHERLTLPHARASLAFLSSDIAGSYSWSSDDLADLMELLDLIPQRDISDLVSRFSAVIQLLRYAAGSQGMQQQSEELWSLVRGTLSSILKLGRQTANRDLRNLLSAHLPHIAHCIWLCTQLSPSLTCRAIKGVLAEYTPTSDYLQELSVLDLVAQQAHIRFTFARRVPGSVDWMVATARYHHDVNHRWVEPSADAELAIPRASMPTDVGGKQSSAAGSRLAMQLRTYVPAAQHTMYEVFPFSDIERRTLEAQREDERTVETQYKEWETSGGTRSAATSDALVLSSSPARNSAEGGEEFLTRAAPVMEAEVRARTESEPVDHHVERDPNFRPDTEEEPLETKDGSRVRFFVHFLDNLPIEISTNDVPNHVTVTAPVPVPGTTQI